MVVEEAVLAVDDKYIEWVVGLAVLGMLAAVLDMEEVSVVADRRID